MQSHIDPSVIRFSKLKTVLSNVEYYKSLIRCPSADAQGLLDAFQSFLNNPDLDIAFKGELLVAAQRLSKKASVYPVCFQLKDSVTQISHEMVASGGFGDIYQGTFQGEVVCIKVLRVYAALDVEHALKELYREAILWGHLLHPNLLTFYGIYRFGNRPCLVAPWMDNGDINNYLRNNPEAPRLYLESVDDIAHGLKYLHESGVVHGDLKGPNILIDNAGRARVADFGISSISDPQIIAWTSCSSAASRGGSIRWQAPELFDMENDEAVENSEASDVYAWGCVCYEIFTGTVPFFHLNRDAAVMYQVKQGTRPIQPPADSPSWREWGLTNPIWTLMQECWKEAPLERPTILKAIGRLCVDHSQDKRPRTTILSPVHFRGTIAEPLDGTAMSTLDRLLGNILGADTPMSIDQKTQQTVLGGDMGPSHPRLFSNVQAPPGVSHSKSLTPFPQTYVGPSHVSPPISPTGDSPMSYATQATGSADIVEQYHAQLTLNLDEDQGQAKFFEDALKLPMSFSAGPFVPQKMYIPPTHNDRRRYVEQAQLQQPIYFWMREPAECGIPLTDALHSRVRRLRRFRDEAAFGSHAPSISIRIQWPGYPQWARQIPALDFRSPPQPITHGKLAKNVAKCVERFINGRTGSPIEDNVDQRWKVGVLPNEIKLEDLILVSMHHVSMGSWQPHLRLRRPFPNDVPHS